MDVYYLSPLLSTAYRDISPNQSTKQRKSRLTSAHQ